MIGGDDIAYLEPELHDLAVVTGGLLQAQEMAGSGVQGKVIGEAAQADVIGMAQTEQKARGREDPRNQRHIDQVQRVFVDEQRAGLDAQSRS